nr:caM kinase-like vesicle-associated protein [Penaeus vannamei]
MGQHPDSAVKLCDFGISRILLADIEVREVLGTPDYVAPEILQYEPISLATDMWSVGVLTYVLLTGHSPFGGDTKQETFLNISQGHVDFPEDLFGDVSEQAKDFISHLLVVEPSGRLSVDEALEHQWLRTAPTPAQPPPLVPVASAPARPEGHADRDQASPRPRTPTDPPCASPRAGASPRVRRHGEAAAAGASSLSFGARREASPRPSSPARPSEHRVKLHVSNFNLKAASAATADLSTKAKCVPAPSRLCRERAEGPAAAATPSPRLTKEPEAPGPFRSRGPSRRRGPEPRGRPRVPGAEPRGRDDVRGAEPRGGRLVARGGLGQQGEQQEQHQQDGGGAAPLEPLQGRARLAQPLQGPLRPRRDREGAGGQAARGRRQGGQGEQGARARRQGQPQGEAEAVAAVPAAPGLQGRPALADGAAEVRAHPGLRGQEDREGHDLLTRLPEAGAEGGGWFPHRKMTQRDTPRDTRDMTL